jgi:hypothetical protein
LLPIDRDFAEACELHHIASACSVQQFVIGRGDEFKKQSTTTLPIPAQLDRWRITVPNGPELCAIPG